MGNLPPQEEASSFLTALTVKALPITDLKYLHPCDPPAFSLTSFSGTSLLLMVHLLLNLPVGYRAPVPLRTPVPLRNNVTYWKYNNEPEYANYLISCTL